MNSMAHLLGLKRAVDTALDDAGFLPASHISPDVQGYVTEMAGRGGQYLSGTAVVYGVTVTFMDNSMKERALFLYQTDLNFLPGTATVLAAYRAALSLQGFILDEEEQTATSGVPALFVLTVPERLDGSHVNTDTARSPAV